MSFLSLNPNAFGLDISDTFLKIVQLKKKGNSFCLACFGKFPLKTGIIEDGVVKDKDGLVGAIKSARTKIQGQEIKTNNVVFSLPEEKTFLQIIQMPLMEQEELEKAVKYEAENYIPLPLNDVYLDFQVIKPIYPVRKFKKFAKNNIENIISNGVYNHLNYLDVLIVALPKSIVDSYITALKEAGLRPIALEVKSQATVRALIKRGVSPVPILIVDIEDQKTDLIIFAGYGIRFTSTIAIGKQTFIGAIARFLEIEPGEAEKMIIRYGVKPRCDHATLRGFGKKKKDVFQALIPVSTDFLEQIKKYLDFYTTHKDNEHLPPDGSSIKKIIVCGEGAGVRGFGEILFKELKIPVEIGDPWINILRQPLKEIPVLPLAESLEYTTVLGLALRGIKKSTDNH